MIWVETSTSAMVGMEVSSSEVKPEAMEMESATTPGIAARSTRQIASG